MHDEIATLIAEMEEADSGSVDLDERLSKFDPMRSHLSPTLSTGDALSRIPRSVEFTLNRTALQSQAYPWSCTLYFHGHECRSAAKTGALAICAAWLRFIAEANRP